MRLPEFIEAAESYGIKLPANITNTHVNHDFWESVLGSLPQVGQGNARNYTPWMVRRLVAWSLIGQVTERSNGASQPLHHQATRLLAAASEGWVVMSEGRASWSPVPPITALRKGAVAIRVPEWRH